MAMAGTVTSGDYKGKSLVIHYKTGLAIMQGLFKKNWISINKESVQTYELIQSEEQISTSSALARGLVGSAVFGPVGAIAAVTAKRKGWFTVTLHFKDGKRSLIGMDDSFYKVLQRNLF